MADLIRELEAEHLKPDPPEFAPGDTVRVLYLVREGEKERIQVFEGVCLGRRGRRDGRIVHGSKGLGGHRRRARLSTAVPLRDRDPGRAAWPRSAGKALLPPRASRQGGPDSGKAHPASPHGRRAARRTPARFKPGRRARRSSWIREGVLGPGFLSDRRCRRGGSGSTRGSRSGGCGGSCGPGSGSRGLRTRSGSPGGRGRSSTAGSWPRRSAWGSAPPPFGRSIAATSCTRLGSPWCGPSAPCRRFLTISWWTVCR